MRERSINRRQQGDLGEVSAIEWLTSVGATVLIPFGHSPHFDLVAEMNGHLLRVQVKTSTARVATQDERYAVALATSGGNQSWTGVVKKLDPNRFEYLFVLTGSGRRWFIPAAAIEGSRTIHLGGLKYSEFDVSAAKPIDDLVYALDDSLQSRVAPGEYRSGQTGGAVNAMAMPSQVRILSPPSSPPVRPSKYERKLGRSGQAVVNFKRRVTIPQSAFFGAGLETGDRLRATPMGEGRIVLERISAASWTQES